MSDPEPQQGDLDPNGAVSERTIWIVNHYAATPDMAAGARHFELARRMVRRGRRVTIFAAGFDHNTGRERRLTGRSLFRTETIEGVRFVWLRTVPYHGNTWRRQLNMASFLLAFLVVQSREPAPGTVVGSTVHPFAALGAWLAARTRHATFVFEIRDLWPQTLVDLGAMRVGSFGERLLRSLEAFLVRRASTVITLLPGMRAYLEERGLPADHVVYIPNGADLASYTGAETPGEAPPTVHEAATEVERLRSEGRLVIGYVGAFGRVNRVDLIAEAATIAEQRAPGRIGLVIVGDGPERAAVERVASAHREIGLIGPMPKQFVPALLTSLDATVVHTTYTPVYRYGISFNKLFEYMAASRPVIFACATAFDPVSASGAGVSIEPDDASRLADAFLELASWSPETLRRMGAAGRAYVEQEHNLDTLAETFGDVVG
jgi:glycosyltransferase involved in cell wall biosynthesis